MYAWGVFTSENLCGNWNPSVLDVSAFHLALVGGGRVVYLRTFAPPLQRPHISLPTTPTCLLLTEWKTLEYKMSWFKAFDRVEELEYKMVGWFKPFGRWVSEHFQHTSKVIFLPIRTRYPWKPLTPTLKISAICCVEQSIHLVSCNCWLVKLITIYNSVHICPIWISNVTQIWYFQGFFYSVFLWEMCWILNNLFLWLAAPIFYNFLPIYLNISTLNLQVFVKAVSTEINAFISKRLAPRAKEVLLHSCPFKKLLYPKEVCDPLHFSKKKYEYKYRYKYTGTNTVALSKSSFIQKQYVILVIIQKQIQRKIQIQIHRYKYSCPFKELHYRSNMLSPRHSLWHVSHYHFQQNYYHCFLPSILIQIWRDSWGELAVAE